MDHDGFFFAGLAGENADAAREWSQTSKEWQAYAARLEAENQKLRGALANWQEAAVDSDARSATKTTLIKELTGKELIEAAGGEERYNELIKQERLRSKELMGADLVKIS